MLPLISAGAITLFTQRARSLSSFISIAAVLASFICSCLIFVQPNISAPQWNWIDIHAVFTVPLGFVLDQLSKMMLVVVSGVGLLIHIYSLGYMREDPGKSRYFAALSLFMFAMFGIVLANNFVMLFIFWELVGFTSYVLIGHWFERDTAAEAANKAFITTRVGDFGFMIGILMTWIATGSVVFDDIVAHLSKVTSNPGYLTIAAILFFCGAVGKSAQFPLHVWLPDAMEGPTPVSALIHAATMVAAGVFMLARSFFLFQPSPTALTIVLWIGLITSLLAALMATQQDDIKRVLAYSTLSQLGLMVAAVGLGVPLAGMFHLFTHAFFKALLFLGAGSVIYSLHHEQNIWQMGGLRHKMPVTFWTFLIGTLALIACPPFAGFWSKDAILASAGENIPAFLAIAAVTFLTAFYMSRLFVVAFLGEARSDHANHAHESPRVMTVPLILLSIPACIAGLPFIAPIFIKVPEHEGSPIVAIAVSLIAVAAGAGSGFYLYKGRNKDEIEVPLFEHKFYFDEFYGSLIKWTQDLLANISGFIDRWVIDSGVVRGLGGLAWGSGFALRFLQIGNLQAYAFLFGAGVVLLLYFILFGTKCI